MTGESITVTDPRFCDQVVQAGPIALVIDPMGRIIGHEVDHLDSHRLWRQFLTDVIGTDVTEVTGSSGRSVARFYLWRSIGRGASGASAQLNATAMMLLADYQDDATFDATPVFGTVVLTGLNERTWAPEPLTADQRRSAAAAIIAAERYAQAVTAVLRDGGRADTDRR